MIDAPVSRSLADERSSSLASGIGGSRASPSCGEALAGLVTAARARAVG